MAISADDVLARTLTDEQRAKAAKRTETLAAEYMTLQQLRKAQSMTQVQLAEALGKQQVGVAQIEKRTDMLLSTLRSYVEAMGGTLNLVVDFPDSAPVILTRLSDDESQRSSRYEREP